MTKDEVFKKIVDILGKYSKTEIKMENISMETSILDDLKINSARLVDIVLDFEDVFDIEVDDDDADSVATVGDGVNLIMAKIEKVSLTYGLEVQRKVCLENSVPCRLDHLPVLGYVFNCSHAFRWQV